MVVLLAQTLSLKNFTNIRRPAHLNFARNITVPGLLLNMKSKIKPYQSLDCETQRRDKYKKIYSDL